MQRVSEFLVGLLFGIGLVLSGMTDRFALEQHKHLFDLDPLFR